MPVLATARALLGSWGTWRGRFITVFVLAQLLLPLRYYVHHRDPHDERFAWRMFSPMRMVQCVPQFTLAGSPVDLRSEFHEAWYEIAARGRFGVVEAMGAELCKRHPDQRIEAGLACTYLGGSQRSYGGYNICSVPQL
jgi:hypothetical protein